ncbi:hypothetical protein T10_2946 [Trichinella papuae]|uniref:Uncharacterized protein n=1 Tax=Trichinella papuae TaxID=268474 RepID=A0A0V1MU34_9BILA|nr:hypothetical protein T10_2946 [Trichinella papuae]
MNSYVAIESNGKRKILLIQQKQDSVQKINFLICILFFHYNQMFHCCCGTLFSPLYMSIYHFLNNFNSKITSPHTKLRKIVFKKKRSIKYEFFKQCNDLPNSQLNLLGSNLLIAQNVGYSHVEQIGETENR